MAAVRRHLSFDEVSSTNAAALEAARAGDPGSFWVTAARQSAGRGRRGRTWVSPEGNLYASLLLIEPAPAAALADLPLVAALGARNGLAELDGASDATLAVKWPNDILLNGKKAVGILLESERLLDGRAAIVIGLGVNVGHVPPNLPYAATGLQQEGITAGLPVVFSAVADGVERALRLWKAGENFAAVRAAWLAHVVGLGSACTVRLENESLQGIFAGLDERGRLILEKADGCCQLISAGDLFLDAGLFQAGKGR